MSGVEGGSGARASPRDEPLGREVAYNLAWLVAPLLCWVIAELLVDFGAIKKDAFFEQIATLSSVIAVPVVSVVLVLWDRWSRHYSRRPDLEPDYEQRRKKALLLLATTAVHCAAPPAVALAALAAGSESASIATLGAALLAAQFLRLFDHVYWGWKLGAPFKVGMAGKDAPPVV